MSIREDKDRVELSLDVNHLTDKKEIRVFILKTWLEEKQGTVYRYFVETLANGKRIYLERPTQKNKGCDFVIFVEDQWLNKTNSNDKPPKHERLFEILRELKNSNNSKDKEQIFNCFQKLHSSNFIPKKITISCNTQKLELALKLARWFFIEQDVTYWNYNGRDMLFGGIKNLWKEQ